MLAEVQQIKQRRKIFFFKAVLEALVIHTSKCNLDFFRVNILSPSTTEMK